jgi:formylglycine-generating enzyme required for sulfatase activity
MPKRKVIDVQDVFVRSAPSQITIAAFDVREQSLEVQYFPSGSLQLALPSDGGFAINEILRNPSLFYLVATAESRKKLGPLVDAGLEIITIPRAVAIYHHFLNTIGVEPCLVLSIGKKRTVCSLIVDRELSAEQVDRGELSFEGLCRGCVYDQADWVKMQSRKNPDFEQKYLDAMESVSETGVKVNLLKNFSVSAPLDLRTSLPALLKFLERVNPKGTIKRLILSDWAATHNNLAELLEKSYLIDPPLPEEAFKYASRGLISYARRLSEKKEKCCPNAECPTGLMPNLEKVCSACGKPLEKATLEMWVRKFLQPALQKEEKLSASSRSRLIDVALRMGIVNQGDIAKLNEYLDPSQPSVKAPAVEDASGSTAAQNTSQDGPVSAKNRMLIASDKKIDSRTATTIGEQLDATGDLESSEDEQKEREVRRAKRANHFLIALLFVILFVVLAFNFAVPKFSTAKEPKPTPSPVEKTPSPKPSPLEMQPPLGMVSIPGGRFMMGRDDGEQFEGPAHTETVEPFYMDQTEVTREAYKECVDSYNSCSVPFGWNQTDYPMGTQLYPVTGVTWNDARRYCEWRKKQLPSETQWEFAARGSDARRYPWGSAWMPNRANLESRTLKPVRSYQAQTDTELFDLIGNAWEWTSSEARDYATQQYLRATTTVRAEDLRIIRGGSFSRQRTITASYRGALLITRERRSYDETGFRCVQPVPQQ